MRSASPVSSASARSASAALSSAPSWSDSASSSAVSASCIRGHAPTCASRAWCPGQEAAPTRLRIYDNDMHRSWRAAYRIDNEDGATGGYRSCRLAGRQTQTREIQFALLGVPQITHVRYQPRCDGPEPCDDIPCVIQPIHVSVAGSKISVWLGVS